MSSDSDGVPRGPHPLTALDGVGEMLFWTAGIAVPMLVALVAIREFQPPYSGLLFTFVVVAAYGTAIWAGWRG